MSQKRFFRQVVEVPQKVNFTHVIDDSAYRLAENSFQRGWIRVEFKTTQIDLFTFQEKESQKAFLILDATEPIHLEEFSKKAYMILIAVGFLTGKFYQNDGYFFGFDDEKMETPVCWKYMELRKSMDAKYYPVHSNAYGIARDHDVAAQFHLKLKPISNPVFSSLCSKLDKEPEFQALMVLQLEACSSSLLLMPTGLFVVLEGFRNLLKLKNGKHFEFLEREISAEIKDKLIEILGAFEKRVPEESHRILKNKITNLDQLPNQTVLMKPFEIFNIPISKADEECIGRRNTFLHGKISLGLYEKGEDKKAGEEMLYHAMKTYTLVSALILKYIGFEGFIINHAKWHEKNAGREIDEPLFIEI